MIGTESAARDLLCASLPDEGDAALARARDLARHLEYLTWADRAKHLDEFLLAEARVRLSPETVTAVVNRHAGILGPEGPVALYAGYCGALLAAVLLLLDELPAVRGVEQALTCLLARSPERQETAVVWIAEHEEVRLQEHLEKLPGYALFFLAACPSDSAESFLARDALWRAMLGPP
ncbi:hypothetical protein SH611_14075 [Geminicoccaceae bacterium 1502E]|nr:hypothetical protein [Geminicoccaceae bacterium 1502E]